MKDRSIILLAEDQADHETEWTTQWELNNNKEAQILSFLPNLMLMDLISGLKSQLKVELIFLFSSHLVINMVKHLCDHHGLFTFSSLFSSVLLLLDPLFGTWVSVLWWPSVQLNFSYREDFVHKMRLIVCRRWTLKKAGGCRLFFSRLLFDSVLHIPPLVLISSSCTLSHHQYQYFIIIICMHFGSLFFWTRCDVLFTSSRPEHRNQKR